MEAAGVITETVLREAMQALVRVQAHMLACEDCGGDPRSRRRCRVGTVVVYRVVFNDMLTTPTS